ncbi:MAG: leucine-rich repeat protein, partial [Clostridia bacterium]|nr:leucine-rich repeat protein [Clostridia bacterium]
SICLVCAVFAIGVFALKTANLKIGGDVSFKATGVEATITDAEFKIGTTSIAPTGFVTGGKIDTSMTQANINQTFATWANLDFDFNEAGDDIVFSFNIKNDSTNPDHYIEIDYEYSFKTATKNVDVYPGTTNEYILKPNTSATSFSLVLKLLDKELDITDNSLDITISLKHIEPVEPTGWAFTANQPAAGEATLTEFTGTLPANKVLEIPAVIKSGGNNYVVTKLYSAGGIEVSPETTSFFSDTVRDVVFPNSIEETEGCMVNQNTINLQSLELPISLKIIGDYLIYSSTQISTTIPNGVTTIKYAFTGAMALKTLTIPANVTTVNGISHCLALVEVVNLSGVDLSDSGLDATNVDIITKHSDSKISYVGDYVFFNGEEKTILVDYVGNDSVLTLPSIDGGYEIGYYAFSRSYATSVTIPEGVTKIAGCAFFGGNTGGGSIILNITSVSFPSTLEEIGASAFFGCPIQTLISPSNVKTIESSAFAAASRNVVKIDSQYIVNQLTSEDAAGAVVHGASSIHIKQGLDVTAATYLTSAYSTTGAVDGDGYILYTLK